MALSPAQYFSCLLGSPCFKKPKSILKSCKKLSGQVKNYHIKTAGLGVRPETDWSPMDGNYHPIASKSANPEIITIISNTTLARLLVINVLQTAQFKIISDIDHHRTSLGN